MDSEMWRSSHDELQLSPGARIQRYHFIDSAGTVSFNTLICLLSVQTVESVIDGGSGAIADCQHAASVRNAVSRVLDMESF
jgi:hypothetical protein